jgi:hypothetical protein
VFCYISSFPLRLLCFLLFPLSLSRSAVSPIAFSIAGIREPLFRSSPLSCTSSPLPLLLSSANARPRARQKKEWKLAYSSRRSGPLRQEVPRKLTCRMKLRSAVVQTRGPSLGGPSFRCSGAPPPPAGRLDLGARRQGPAPEAGRRSNTTQLRRPCYKLLSNTTERGGVCVVLDGQFIGVWQTAVLKSSHIQLPGPFRSPWL